MPIGPRPPRLAVLIDAENVPASIAPRLLAAAATLGETRILRCYGQMAALRNWEGAITAFAIEALAMPAGKNAADIAITIDAMDMIHAGAIDGLCLASRDSDFRALAVRTREAGVICHGFCHIEPPTTFRAACSGFTVLPNAPTFGDLIRRAMAGRCAMGLGELGSALRKNGYVPGAHGPGKLRDLVAKCPAFVVAADNIVRPRQTPRLIAAE